MYILLLFVLGLAKASILISEWTQISKPIPDDHVITQEIFRSTFNLGYRHCLYRCGTMEGCQSTCVQKSTNTSLVCTFYVQRSSTNIPVTRVLYIDASVQRCLTRSRKARVNSTDQKSKFGSILTNNVMSSIMEHSTRDMKPPPRNTPSALTGPVGTSDFKGINTTERPHVKPAWKRKRTSNKRTRSRSFWGRSLVHQKRRCSCTNLVTDYRHVLSSNPVMAYIHSSSFGITTKVYAHLAHRDQFVNLGIKVRGSVNSVFIDTKMCKVILHRKYDCVSQCQRGNPKQIGIIKNQCKTVWYDRGFLIYITVRKSECVYVKKLIRNLPAHVVMCTFDALTIDYSRTEIIFIRDKILYRVNYVDQIPKVRRWIELESQVIRFAASVTNGVLAWWNGGPRFYIYSTDTREKKVRLIGNEAACVNIRIYRDYIYLETRNRRVHVYNITGEYLYNFLRQDMKIRLL